MRTAIFIVTFILLAIGVAFSVRHIDFGGEKAENKKEKKEKKKDKDVAPDSEISIINKWDVPEILKEISAVCYLGENRFACVQDELGAIFIYNTSSKKIEKEIEFAAPGDFEGLEIVGSTAYVLRADGNLFEVKNYTSEKPVIIEYNLALTVDQNPEGLGYDAKNNRLLIAIKGNETNADDYKGIYAFNLKTNVMDRVPAFVINLEDEIFTPYKGKKSGSEMQPAALAIDPLTGDIYITEATKPKLLVLDSAGKIKSLRKLSSSEFNQPEGITFSPEGRIFISNEGKGKKIEGNILEIKRF